MAIREHERQRLNYAPHLEYIRALVLEEGELEREQEIESVLSSEIKSQLEYPVSSLISDRESMEETLTTLLRKIEKRLKGDIQETEVGRVSFQSYKQSLEKDDPTEEDSRLIQSYEEAHLDSDGDAFVLAYSVLKALDKEVKMQDELMEKTKQQVQGDHESLQDAEIDLLAEWAKKEVQLQSMDTRLRTMGEEMGMGDTPGPLANEFYKLSVEVDPIRAFVEHQRLNPLYSWVSMAGERVHRIHGNLQEIDRLLEFRPQDYFDGDFEDILVGVLCGSPPTAPIERFIDAIDGILAAMEISNLRISRSTLDIKQFMINFLTGIMRQLLYQVMNEMIDRLMEQIYPVLDVLENISECEAADKLHVQDFVDIILDGVESSKKGVEMIMLDLAKAQGNSSKQLDDFVVKFSHVNKIREMRKVLKKLRQALKNRGKSFEKEGDYRLFASEFVEQHSLN